MYILHLSDIHYRREFGKGFRNANGDGYQNMLSAMQNPTVFLDECLDRVAGDRETVDLVVVTGDLTEEDVYKRQVLRYPGDQHCM